MKIRTNLVALSLVIAPGLAIAANTIQFQGNVSASTCSVSINNSSTAIVLLPTVNTDKLTATDSQAGETNFKLSVSGCPSADTPKNLIVRFVGNNTDAGGLLNSSGTAANVKLVISSIPGGKHLNVNNWQSSTPEEGITLLGNRTSAERDYYVRYHATGPATAGTVLGSMQYAISYP